ncbi:MAG: hypothetical protein AAGC71_10095 [Pseudomonadota bacterium]
MFLRSVTVVAALAVTTTAAATEFVVGGGFGADDASGRSLAALVDVGVTDSTFLTLTAAASEGDTLTDTIETQAFTIGITQDIGDFTGRFSIGTWGDSDFVDSIDYRAGLAVTAAGFRFGLDAERRDIDLTLRIEPGVILPGRDVGVDLVADGIGGNVRYRNDDGFSIGVRGMRWDYDRNIAAAGSIERVLRLNPTTLSIAGALRESTLTGSVEWPLGDHLVGIEIGRDTLEIGGLEVDSATLLWTLPAGKRTDLELSVGYSEADGAEGAYFANVFVYFFGGN